MDKKEVEVPAKFKKLVEEIEKMSVLDLHTDLHTEDGWPDLSSISAQ